MTNLSYSSRSSSGVQYISSGQFLKLGEALYSENGVYSAMLRSDGQFCIYLKDQNENTSTLYHSIIEGPEKKGEYYALLREDGNFCVHAGSDPGDDKGMLWYSDVKPVSAGPYFAIMQNDGHFCIYAGTEPGTETELLWHSFTSVPSLHLTLKDDSGQIVNSGVKLQALPDSKYPWGMQIRAEANNTPDEIVRATNWEFFSTMISSRVQTQTQGSTTLYPPGSIMAGKYILFSVPLPAKYEFIVDITMQHRSGSRRTVRMHGEFDTLKPKVEIETRYINRVRINTTRSGLMMQLGNPIGLVPGMPGMSVRFLVRVDTIEERGRIGIIQLMRGRRDYVRSNGSLFNVNTGAEWYLDREVRDGRVTYAGAVCDLPLPHGGTGTLIAMDDSPGVGLRDSFTKITVDETFRVYLVYKPDINMGWAPLGYVEWRWAAELTRSGASSPWPTEFTVAPYQTPREALVFVPSYELPPWNHTTIELAERTIKELGFFPGELQPKWDQGITDARQMLIRHSVTDSAEFRKKIEETTGTRISKLFYGYNQYLVWTSPANAERARSVPGVLSVNEVAATQKYIPPSPKVPSQEKEFHVTVAPFALFGDMDDNMDFARITAPATIQDVGEALVKMAGDKNVRGVIYKKLMDSKLKLTFPAVPDSNLIFHLASHPLVNFIERDPHFKPDDPIIS